VSGAARVDGAARVEDGGAGHAPLGGGGEGTNGPTGQDVFGITWAWSAAVCAAPPMIDRKWRTTGSAEPAPRVSMARRGPGRVAIP